MKFTAYKGVPVLEVKKARPRQTTIYGQITEVVRKAILEGHIRPGTVLLEGHLAELLRSTRTPVRQALRQLEHDGLISRFEGRGFLVGAVGFEPLRLTLTGSQLGIADSSLPARKTLAWESIYDEVERNVVHLSVCDRFRINEVELARHFGVGRIAARDVLLRLESLGLMEKDERQRWVMIPLDEHHISNLFELRLLLEPAALRAAMARGPAPEIKNMMADLRKAISAYPDLARASMDQLEHDLHVRYLSRCPNRDLLHSLQRTRCILTLSKHVLGASVPMPNQDPFMSEHLAVFSAVAQGDAAEAEKQLRRHLEASCGKVLQRANLVRDHYAIPNLTYVYA